MMAKAGVQIRIRGFLMKSQNTGRNENIMYALDPDARLPKKSPAVPTTRMAI